MVPYATATEAHEALARQRRGKERRGYRSTGGIEKILKSCTGYRKRTVGKNHLALLSYILYILCIINTELLNNCNIAIF